MTAKDGGCDRGTQGVVQSLRHRCCGFADGNNVNGFVGVEFNIRNSYLRSTNFNCASRQFFCVYAAQGSIEDIDGGITKMAKLNFGQGKKTSSNSLQELEGGKGRGVRQEAHLTK